jgi:hypothetical protein
MHRRSFVRMLAAAAAARASASLDVAAQPRRRAALVRSSQVRSDTPALRIVSSYSAAAIPGMPGPYPGRVVSVKSDKCVDTSTGAADDLIVREMMARGMRALTGASTTTDAWRRFFEPADIVGIKVNCGGYPHCVSAYEIVADVVLQLMGIGVPASQIYVYERFQNQMDEVNYAPHLPEGVQIVAAEGANRNVAIRRAAGFTMTLLTQADLVSREALPSPHRLRLCETFSSRRLVVGEGEMTGRNLAEGRVSQRVSQTRPSCVMCTTVPSNPFAVIS